MTILDCDTVIMLTTDDDFPQCFSDGFSVSRHRRKKLLAKQWHIHRAQVELKSSTVSSCWFVFVASEKNHACVRRLTASLVTVAFGRLSTTPIENQIDDDDAVIGIFHYFQPNKYRHNSGVGRGQRQT